MLVWKAFCSGASKLQQSYCEEMKTVCSGANRWFLFVYGWDEDKRRQEFSCRALPGGCEDISFLHHLQGTFFCAFCSFCSSAAHFFKSLSRARLSSTRFRTVESDGDSIGTEVRVYSCVCVYVCMYVCLSACMHAFMYVCVYILAPIQSSCIVLSILH